ncbi:CBS domain-containing protein [Dactylosporangium sp. NPDC049140]|uniref:CBS domain-containing protein n=1 Tax=Dactylosporangium sp. NPDC049140 TaxID=3155647 RepID=UPI0034029EBA
MDEVADIARLMVEQGLHVVPIVTDDHVIGVVSRTEVLRTIMPTDEAAGQEAQRRLDAYAGGERRSTITVEDGAALLSGNLDNATERNVVAALVETTTEIDTVRIRAQP